jgi:hypothetical protein
MTANTVVFEAHQVARPVKEKDRNMVPVTLPDRVAKLYLDMVGDWRLKPLLGVSTTPLLANDGSIRNPDGYDPVSGLWCRGIPALYIPEAPTQDDAAAALLEIRTTFRTFPFADAAQLRDGALDVVDLSKPIGMDESAFLAGLMTAVCRPSLHLAPGLVVSATPFSGAGTGKGLLVRCICAIAFGIRPNAFTPGDDRLEFEKRLASDLIEASPAVFVDNANSMALRSNLLASVMTERPCRVRLLGSSRMVPLNSVAFIAITGNGITLAEDLVRRFLACELDAKCEDPETRPFPGGFLEEIEGKRIALLKAVLTIWRWGRQNELKRGASLGSFERWCAWVRDPLLALGCKDPVTRIQDAKANDPRRRNIADLFAEWWEIYDDTPVMVSSLVESVTKIIDPQGRGRQYVATVINGLVGVRLNGFVLTRQMPAGKWGASTYALQQV